MEPKRTLHSGNLVRGICAEEEERFIKKLVDAEVASKPILARGELLDFKDRGQRRKLQLYGDNGERES